MSDRLSDELLAVAAADGHFPYPGSGAVLRRAAREVLASRKLIADLRALHRTVTETKRGPYSRRIQGYNEPYDVTRCRACNETSPCPTIRLIEEAGL